MKKLRVALFESKTAQYKALTLGLKKAGLTVTTAKVASELTSEDMVVLGPSVSKAKATASSARKRLPGVFIWAAKKTGFSAPQADAVLPLPLSVPDLKARLLDWAKQRKGAPARKSDEKGLAQSPFYPFQTFKEFLFIEVKRAKRYGLPLSMALVAPDVLPVSLNQEARAAWQQGLALAIRRTLRDIDFAVSYEPERVLLLMPHTPLTGALTVAQRIVERISRTTVEVKGSLYSPTVSIGVAQASGGNEFSFAELVRRAQASLQSAQKAGGNRVEFFDAASEVLSA